MRSLDNQESKLNNMSVTYRVVVMAGDYCGPEVQAGYSDESLCLD